MKTDFANAHVIKQKIEECLNYIPVLADKYRKYKIEMMCYKESNPFLRFILFLGDHKTYTKDEAEASLDKNYGMNAYLSEINKLEAMKDLCEIAIASGTVSPCVEISEEDLLFLSNLSPKGK